MPDESVALLLSGGIDSITIGLASENAGKKVHAYSFYLDGSPSYDFIKAAEVAHKKNWHFTPIVVPRNNLIKDWHRLVELKCRKKTHFECVFPFLYVYPKIKETYVLTGWGADGYFGDCAGLKEHTNLATKHNKVHITPYLDADVRQLLMGMDWKELNKPRQKEIVRKDFTELKKFGIIKSHQNLHLGAGIQYLFETLLDNKDINFKDRKRMMDVCRDWYEKERHGILPI